MRALNQRLALAVGTLGVAACCVLVAASRGFYVEKWPLLYVLLAWSALAAAVAVLAVRVLSPRVTVSAGLLLAAGLQTVAMIGGPQLSDDLYRYVWDARVAAAGIDPYAYPPIAYELVPLRTPELWPDPQVCQIKPAERDRWDRSSPFLGLNEVCTPINRPEVRTIYPPAAQLAFRAAYLSTEGLPVELRVELPMALVSLALTGLLMRVLLRSGRHPGSALAYAVSPLAVVECGMDGHIDVLAALVGVLCLLTASSDRLRPRAAAVLTGTLFAVAVLIKFYPALLALPLIARWGLRSAHTWLAAGIALAVSATLYAPHVAASGQDVFGFLTGYLKENDYGGGGRFLILSLVLPAGKSTTVVAALLIAAVAFWSLRQRPVGRQALLVHASTTLGLLLLIVTPGAAWYYALLTACALLAGRPEWQALTAAAYVAYFVALQPRDPLFFVTLRPDEQVIAQVGFALAAVIVAAVTKRRRARGESNVAVVTKS